MGAMPKDRRGSRREIWNRFAIASACGALLVGCGARTALSDFGSAAGSSASEGSSAGSRGTCSDTQNDAVNCGACGAACKGECTSGRCLVKLVEKQMNVGCLAVDGSDVFWASADLPASGRINRISHDGGAFSTISTTNSAPWPCRMALDAMFVYWTDGSSGAVLKARTRGGIAMTLAMGSGANSIAIDAASAYFVGQTVGPMKVPLTGGTPTLLVAAYGGNGGNGVAVDATSLYWTGRGPRNVSGSVAKVALSGGTPTLLASGQGGPDAIAADDSSVYWTDYAAGTIQKVSHDGGGVKTLTSEQLNPPVIVVDQASVYWSTSAGTLAKVPKNGGSTTILALSTALDIAVDATSLYWTDGSAILKLTPK